MSVDLTKFAPVSALESAASAAMAGLNPTADEIAADAAAALSPVSKTEATATAAVKAPRPRKAPPAPLPSRAATPATPEPAPPVFVGGKPRSADFPLDWPVFYDGVTYTAIVLRRPTKAEVDTFMDELLAGASAPFPVFYTADDAPVPLAVIEKLDLDDRDRIMERLPEFLPVRLQRLAEALSGPAPIAADDAPAAPPAST